MDHTDLTNGATEGISLADGIVYRPRDTWSTAVEALLLHLEEIGFEYCPRFCGIDPEGRQMLSYIEGEVGTYPASQSVWRDDALACIGKILRAFHDATVSFNWRSFHSWQLSCPTEMSPDVLCHNDFATYNCVYRNGLPVAMIDFDTVGPGTRSWDLAYTAFRCIPIGTPKQQKSWGVPKTVEIRPRLELLVEAYGYDDQKDILNLIAVRIGDMRDRAAMAAQGNDRNAKRIRDEGHVESYEEALSYFKASL